MSQLVFPNLPGIAIERTRSPEWTDIVHRAISGRAVALSPMTTPNWRYKLKFEFLRAGAEAELQAIVGLFNQMHGRADTFLFDDVDDNAASNQQFALGDGNTTSFRLVRSYAGFIEPVLAVKGTPQIRVGGAIVTPLAILDGIVTLSAPPAAGVALTWTGSFYWRCRFDSGTLDTERFLHQLWKLNSLTFTTEKP